MLGGIAVANHGLLDLHGLVRIHLQPRLPDGEQNHTPALGHPDAGGDILAEEQLLDGHTVGLADLQKLAHILIDHFQTGRKIRVGRGGDGPAAQEGELSPAAFNQTEARGAVAGIDSQDPHIRRG